MIEQNKKIRRLNRVRSKVAKNFGIPRLSVFRSNQHIYANIIDATGEKVLVTASTVETDLRAELAGKQGKGGNTDAAALVGKRIAEKALAATPA